MWRAIRQMRNENYDKLVDVNVMECLNWQEVNINVHEFFTGYLRGRYEKKGWPQILKIKDWLPPDVFAERLPRHFAGFIYCLPFKEYTHPHKGQLNLAIRLPELLEPDIGPKTYMAYGCSQELGRGDSVSKLHCHMSDVVNILTHAHEVILDSENLFNIEHLKKLHSEQDKRELFAHKIDGTLSCVNQLGKQDERGAVWDIFWREDDPKLQNYLWKHFREFRHIHCCPLQKVVHPIHDETFYLTVEHKRKLKDEYELMDSRLLINFLANRIRRKRDLVLPKLENFNLGINLLFLSPFVHAILLREDQPMMIGKCKSLDQTMDSIHNNMIFKAAYPTLYFFC